MTLQGLATALGRSVGGEVPGLCQSLSLLSKSLLQGLAQPPVPTLGAAKRDPVPSLTPTWHGGGEAPSSREYTVHSQQK